MKHHRLFMYFTTAGAILAFAFVGYSYYLGGQTRERLGQHFDIPALEQYERIHEAMVAESASPEAAPVIQDSPAWTQMRDGFARMESVSRAVEGLTANGSPWEALWQSRYNRPPSSWSEAEWEALATFIAQQETLLKDIRALSGEPGPLCPIDFEVLIDQGVPHLKPVRDMARLLSISALVRARAGDPQGAGEDILAGYRLAARLHHEPLTISQIARFSMEDLMKESIVDAFPAGEIPGALLRDLEAHFQSRQAPEDMRQAWLLGREQVLDSLAGIATASWENSRQGVTYFYEQFGFERLTSNVLVHEWYISPIGTPWRNFDLQSLADSTAELEGVFQLPYAEARDRVNNAVEILPSTRYIARTVLPFTLAHHEHLSSSEARQRLLLLGAAVERYAAEHGEFPETLGDVTAETGDNYTVDPFTGEPFRYYVRNGSFQLYSVGSNLTDDGGLHHRSEGDIVWRGREETE